MTLETMTNEWMGTEDKNQDWDPVPHHDVDGGPGRSVEAIGAELT
jgi:hypothetical protein